MEERSWSLQYFNKKNTSHLEIKYYFSCKSKKIAVNLHPI